MKTENAYRIKQGVALTGRNRTVPPCSVGGRTGHVPGPAAADRPRALQTTTDDRRQRAKQYWSIRRVSSNLSTIIGSIQALFEYSHFIRFIKSRYNEKANANDAIFHTGEQAGDRLLLLGLEPVGECIIINSKT